MKIKAIAVLLGLVVLAGAWAGGGSESSGGSSSSGKAEPFVVDLSKLPLTKNTKAFEKRWDHLVIPTPESVFEGIDITKYRRVTAFFKFYDLNNVEKEPTWQSNGIFSIVYDTTKWDGQDGPNQLLKEFNPGMKGGDATISTPKGSPIRINRLPGGVIIQNSNVDTGYIELTLLVFHNGDWEPAE